MKQMCLWESKVCNKGTVALTDDHVEYEHGLPSIQAGWACKE